MLALIAAISGVLTLTLGFAPCASFTTQANTLPASLFERVHWVSAHPWYRVGATLAVLLLIAAILAEKRPWDQARKRRGSAA